MRVSSTMHLHCIILFCMLIKVKKILVVEKEVKIIKFSNLFTFRRGQGNVLLPCNNRDRKIGISQVL